MDDSDHRKSWRRSWRAASPLTKMVIIIGAIGAAAAALSSVTNFVVSRIQISAAKMEDRPRVIVSRPPELLGTVQCYVTDKAIHFSTGTMRIWVKNLGKGDAINVFLAGPGEQLVPQEKTGVSNIDDVPTITDQICGAKVSPTSKMFPVYSGQEISIDMSQSVGMQSLIKTGSASVAFGSPQPEPEPTPGKEASAPVQIARDALFLFYDPICVYYSDRSGAPYGSCRTYRLNLGKPIDGLYSFSCTQTPIQGFFEATIGNYCEN
jgi:hypothetical protein